MAHNYWLMKTEPDVFSIDKLKKDRTGHWDGVRNYQARNYMKNDMKSGDLILFYHSSCDVPGVAGLARVLKEAYPDFTQWDKKSESFEPRATKENPVWFMVDVEFVEKFPHFVSLGDLRSRSELEGILVLKKGMRLSIQPVNQKHFEAIVKLGQK